MSSILSTVHQWLVAHETGLSSLQSVLTCLAMLAGGAWALYTFWWKREKFPKATLGVRFDLFRLPDGRQLLRSEIVVENVSEQLLPLRSIVCRVHRVLPLAVAGQPAFQPQPTPTQPEVIWPLLSEMSRHFETGEREIEPHEKDAFQFDCLLAPEIDTVIVYFFVLNPTKAADGLGWEQTETVRLAALPTPAKP